MFKYNLYSLKEKLLLIVFSVLGVFSLLFFLNFKSQAFPEYNLDLKIDRSQVEIRAKEEAKELSISAEGFKQATIFTVDEPAKVYLERNVGVQETGRLAENEIGVWYFNSRLFKPLEKTEYTFSFLTNGNFIGFNSEIEESAKGASLEQPKALEIARSFIIQKLNSDSNNWELISSETQQRPNRKDHTFIWHKKGILAKDAVYLLEIKILGDKVGSYREFLRVPEAWQRQYEEERSKNDLAQVVAESATLVFFGITIIYTFIIGYRHHNLRSKFALRVGLVIAVITFLATINELPLILYYYPTTQSYFAFLLTFVFGSVASSFFMGLMIFLVLAAGESIYRKHYPDAIFLEEIVPYGLLTKPIVNGLLIGFLVGLVFLGFVVLFYLIGQQFNFWTPADTNYSDIYNTYIPWIYPLLVGLSAAVFEEGVFRLFGITFLRKYLKSNVLAVIVTSVVWAFLHSNYPQSPWYARGIEITLVGFVLGFLYLRFGILASVSAHYTFNALQTAIFFYSSGSSYVNLTSTFVAVLPLVIAILGIIYALRKKHFLDFKPFINATYQKVAESQIKLKLPEIINLDLPYNKISGHKWAILSILAMLLIIGASIVSFDSGFNEIKPIATRDEILKKSKNVLQEENIDSSGYIPVVVFNTQSVDSLVEKYVIENAGYDTFKNIYPEKIPLDYWSVRFFKQLQKDEYIVRLFSDGTFYSVDYVLDEKGHGKNLTSEEALNIANKYLQDKGYYINNLKLLESKGKTEENRIDYFLTFEDQTVELAEAKLQINLDILGDKPSGFEKYIKLPEDWVRKHQETKIKDVLSEVAITLITGSIFVLTVLTFLSLFRHKQIQFKSSLKFSLIVVSIMVLSQLNKIPTFYSFYNTSVPITTFTIQAILIAVLGIIISGLLLFLVISTTLTLWRKNLNPIIPLQNRAAYFKDAVFSAYLALLIMFPAIMLIEYVLVKLKWAFNTATFNFNLGFDEYLPVVTALEVILLGTVAFLVVSNFLIVTHKYLISWKKVFLLMIVYITLSSIPGSVTVEDFVKAFTASVLNILVIIFLVVFVLGKNFLSYLLLIFTGVTLIFGLILLNQQNQFYLINGLVLAVMGLLPLIIFFLYKIFSVRK